MEAEPQPKIALPSMVTRTAFKLPDPQDMPIIHQSKSQTSHNHLDKLIGMAVVRGPRHRRTLDQIMDCISATFPYYAKLSRKQLRKVISASIYENGDVFIFEKDTDGAKFVKIRPGEERDYVYPTPESYLEPCGNRTKIVAAPKKSMVGAHALTAFDKGVVDTNLSQETSSTIADNAIHAPNASEFALPIGIGYHLVCHYVYGFSTSYAEVLPDVCGETDVTAAGDSLTKFVRDAIKQVCSRNGHDVTSEDLQTLKADEQMKCQVYVNGDPESRSLAFAYLDEWNEIEEGSDEERNEKLCVWIEQRAAGYDQLVAAGDITPNAQRNSIRSEIRCYVYPEGHATKANAAIAYHLQQELL